LLKNDETRCHGRCHGMPDTAMETSTRLGLGEGANDQNDQQKEFGASVRRE